MKSLLKYSLIVFFELVNGQTTNTYVPNIASSPETAKFNQFIDTPVGYNTGIPNIDINLGEINIEGVSVPISLSYHADGIKADEKATWVGLGWNLNAGYKVSRKENGIPDESRLFYQLDSNSLSSIQGIKNFSDNSDSSIADANVLSTYLNKDDTGSDYRPDEFNYSTSNSSAKFLFSQLKQKFVTFPSNMDKIEVNYFSNTINNIEILDDKGIKYYYGMDTNSIERINPLLHYFNSTWNISTIENIKNETIDFSYKSYSLQHYERTITQLNDYALSFNGHPITNTESSYITEINYPEGKIEFVSEVNREDLKQYPKLHSIIFKNKINQVIKTIILNYSYFLNNEGNVSSDNYTENSGKRLKLDSIDLYNNLNNAKQSYSFSYYDTNIPDRFNGGKDYWGYYNGTTSQDGIPSHAKYQQSDISADGESKGMDGYFSGADRNINPNYVNTFLLKEITYPTGAKQEYIYENNLGKLSNNNDQTYFCLANKYLPINQHLENYFISISGLFDENNSDGIYFGYPQPSEIITLNQSEKKYIFRTSIPIKNGTFKSIGMLYTNSLSHNFDKATQGVTNSDLLKMGIEERRYLIKNGLRTLISGSGGTLPISLFRDMKPISSYLANLLNDDYDTFEIEISFIYNKSITSQLKYKPFSFHYNLDDVKKDNSQTYYLDNLYLVGGARIKEIDVKDNSVIKKRVYNYSNNVESGLAYFIPSFSERRVKYDVLRDVQCGIACGYIPTYHWSINSEGSYTSSNGGNVAYEYIEEKIYGVNNSYLGKTAYRYYLSRYSNDVNYISFETHPYSFINTYDWVNKSLRSKKIYGSSDDINPLFQESYEYFFNKPNTIDSVDEIRTDLINDDITRREGGTNCLNSIFFPYNFQNTKRLPYFKHYLGFSLPKRKTTTEYLKGIPVINTTDYNYNFNGDLLQLTSQITTNSKEGILTQKFYYPQDLSSEPFMSNLISQNRIGEPIKTEKFNGAYKLAESHNKFAEFPSTDASKKLYLQKENFLSKNSNIDINSSIDRKITYDQYDTNGTLLQYTPEKSTPISIIWGYNKTQPIAKIENATYIQIAAYIDNLQTLSNTDSEEELLTALNNLRNASELTNALVTTYTYIPLIGLSTITDAKGYKMSYEYDSFGRLQYIKDSKNNILKDFAYNYKNDVQLFVNKNISKLYTRNNCGLGTIGGSVLYNVPAGKHNASTQALADQLAQNDIDTNGQNYANTIGACTTENSCSFVQSSSIPTFTTSTIGFTGSTVTFSFVFTPSSSQTSYFQYYQSVVLGNITSGCNPTVQRRFNYTESTSPYREWEFTVETTGSVSIRLSYFSGSSTDWNTTISINNVSFQK